MGILDTFFFYLILSVSVHFNTFFVCMFGKLDNSIFLVHSTWQQEFCAKKSINIATGEYNEVISS